MKTAFLVTTTACTRECPYCFYVTGAMERIAPDPSTDELCRCIGGLTSRGYRRLILTGGEPLLRPDLPDLVREAAGAGAGTLLLTNGELLTGGICASLARSGLGAVSVSVDSLEKGCYKSSLDAALAARRSGLAVTLITVVTRQNADAAGGLARWSKREGIAVIFQPAYVPPGSDRYRSLSLHELNGDGWRRLKAVLEEWALDCGAGGYLSLFLAIYEGGDARPGFCDMGAGAVVVDCDGSVYPCFHRRDLPCGNLVRDDGDAVFGRLGERSLATAGAQCYGEHCISLFFGQA